MSESQAAQRVHLLIAYLDGDAPVQATGTINGYAFYFRARGNAWKFAVASRREAGTDEAIRVAAGEIVGFIMTRRYGREHYDASILSYELAMTIIRRCALAFVAYTAYQEQAAS